MMYRGCKSNHSKCRVKLDSTPRWALLREPLVWNLCPGVQVPLKLLSMKCFSSQSLSFGSQSKSNIPWAPTTGGAMMLFRFYSHLCTVQADLGTGQDLCWNETQFASQPPSPHPWLCPRVSHVSDSPGCIDPCHALWVCIFLSLWFLCLCLWTTLIGSLFVFPRSLSLGASGYLHEPLCLSLVSRSVYLSFYSFWLMYLSLFVPICVSGSLSLSLSVFPSLRTPCLIHQAPSRTSLSWFPTPTELSYPFSLVSL